MGNCIRILSEGASLIASDDTWIEGKSIQQLQNTRQLAGMRRVVGMPDLHPGRGYPVGAAFFCVGRLYPALVGNDIGCGISLWRTSIASMPLRLDKLERRLGNIDAPLDQSWQGHLAALGLPPSGHERSLGTIGGGNHFAELQQFDEVYESTAVAALGLEPGRLVLLVHSGSRGLGEAILREHVEHFGHDGLEQGSASFAQYLMRHGQALQFAGANRRLIAQRMLARLHAEGEPVLDVDHNMVSPAMVDGVGGWLHRKGATPADCGPVLIPGSRGDFSYLVRPLADERSLYSLAHGAGRKWMRGDCKERLARYSVQQLSRTALGGRVICEDRQLMYEEAPQAYKPIDSVVGTLKEAGLVQLLARLKPVLTYKTRGES